MLVGLIMACFRC